MRKTYWLIALAAIILGVAAYPRASKPAPDASPAGGLAADVARLEAELAEESAARERDVAKLEAQLRALAAGIHSASEQPAAVVAALATGTAHAEEVVPPEQLEPRDHLEETLAAQPIDADWAQAAKDRLEQKVRESLPGARVQSIECHASLCRLETVHADATAYGQFVSEAFKDPDKRIWDGDAYSDQPSELAGGQLVVVSYLAREGETLPEIR